MLPLINGLFLNVQYAEIPDADFKNVVDLSYRPVLKMLVKRKKEKFLFAITGYSIEYLAKNYPDVIKLIKQLVKCGTFELMGSSYSNPVLALLSSESKERHIKVTKDLIKNYFGVTPAGFHLPEFAWDPTLSETLKKFGYSWTILLQHQIDFSMRPNEHAIILTKRPSYSAEIWKKVAYRSILRKLYNLPKIQYLFNKEIKISDYEPFRINGVNNDIVAFKTVKTWTGFVIASSGNHALQTTSKLKSVLNFQAINAKGLFIPFFADMENINFRGNSPIDFTLDNFITFLDTVAANKKLFYQSPAEYLEKNKITKEIYIKTSSGEPGASLDLWKNDPDSIRLDVLCDEIRNKLSTHKNIKTNKEVERLLMLAESGDGRGWNPVSERKLFCFNAAVKALKLLK